MSVDSVFRTRSLGVAAEGLPDQYADGKAARVWELYVGDTQSRTQEYRSWVVSLLRRRGVRTVLDAACGTGVDSIMLVEEGFQVVSVDASDKMLKFALKARWERRKEAAFDQWVIEEANWLTLPDDVQRPADGFDAVICLGNSFAHLPDFKGDQSEQRLALRNIASMVRPGGVLIIDHRNYDYILETGRAPQGKNIYYKVTASRNRAGTGPEPGRFSASGAATEIQTVNAECWFRGATWIHLIQASDLTQDITTSVLWVNSRPHMVTLDYTIQVPQAALQKLPEVSKFRLSYYPHRLQSFGELLSDAFGANMEHSVYGDFRAFRPGLDPPPCYFIHVCQRTA